MKTLILLLITASAVCAQNQTSRYKAGFQYYDHRGLKTTLLRWEKVDVDHYRWRTRVELASIKTYTWTDDCWIDIATGKAFLNERTHQIVYYDSVDIVPKKTNPIKD